MKKLLFIFAFFLAACTFAAADDSLQEQLRKQYVNPERVQILRNFYMSGDPRYDLAGNLIGKSESGPWTLYGGIIIEQLVLRPDHLEVHGHRAAFVYDVPRAKLVPERWDSIIIEIATREAPDQSAQLHMALEKVFTSPGADTINSLPDYWQPYYSGTQNKRTPREATPPTKEDTATSMAPANKPVHPPPGKGVVDGRLKNRVNPAYTALARAAHIEGTCKISAVIDKTGRLKNIVIVQPIGAGLDEEAIKAVRQWEYDPYRLNGEPIQIETTIVIRFHL